MTEELALDTQVAFWDVDRDQKLLLRRLLCLLQEAAIRHADQVDAGSRAVATRGESWVLYRLAARINRYPEYGDPVRIRTWSTGIRGVRGYRDYRLECRGDTILSASSLWLYVNFANRTPVRVPRGVAATFPTRPGDVFRDDLDELAFEAPRPEGAPTEVTVRFSDIDSNAHVNNTAYFDYLQTALAGRGLDCHPGGLLVQFVKEVRPGSGAVRVALEARADGTRFAVTCGGDTCAVGVSS